MANKVTLKAVKLIANANDNRLFVSATPADNVYVPGGVQLNLSPGNIQDPNALGVVGPSQVPAVNPGVFSESMGGFYAAVVPTAGAGQGSAGLAAYKLQFFAPGGAEIGAGAYNAAITGGTLILEIPYEA